MDEFDLEYAMYASDTVYDAETNRLQIIKTLELQGEFVSDTLYLDEETFTKYLDVLLYQKDYNICTLTSPIVLDYFIILDLFRLTYKIPETIYGFINLCMMRPTVPNFYVIPLKIQYDLNIAHSNVIIVNMEKHEIEYFEPHGLTFNLDDAGYNIQNIVLQIVTNMFPLLQFTVKNVSSQCPIGPQTVQSVVNPNSGHCLAWSLLYIHLRIINMNLKSDVVINYLSKFNGYELDLMIRRYISKLQRELLFFPSKQYDQTRTFNIQFSQEEQIHVRNKIASLVQSLYGNDNSNNKDTLKQLLLYNNFPDFYEIFFDEVNNVYKK
jgi:hypothetical protein